MNRLVSFILVAAVTAPIVFASSDHRNDHQAVADMNAPSEAIPIDPQFDWAYHPKVTMRFPRGDAIPDWWRGDRPLWTTAILSWFTLLEGQGNGAVNSAVQLKNLCLFIYSRRERRWMAMDAAAMPAVALWEYPFRRIGTGPETAGSSDTVDPSYRPVYPRFYHGWGNARNIDAPDVGGVFVTMEFRLSRIDSAQADDRAKAKYLVGVGADYYPDMGLHWSLDFAPGVGNGRLLLAKREWRTASFFILNLADPDAESKAMKSLPDY